MTLRCPLWLADPKISLKELFAKNKQGKVSKMQVPKHHLDVLSN